VRIVGVDPGAHGGVALLVDGRLERAVDMPAIEVRRGKSDKAEVDGYALATLLREMQPAVVVVEQVGGIQGQSASAAFNFGRAAGAPEYIAKALGIRVEHVTPMRWKKALGLNAGKDGSRAMAMRLWPSLAALFARKKDNDRAEAALLAHWFQLQQPQHGGGDVFA
jgi:crossover junction endodeoxyribonuclease RuvC